MPEPTYGPDMFAMDLTLPDPATILNEPLPRAWSEGGIIESVKRAVIAGLREEFARNALGQGSEQKFYVDIEYPTKEAQYPGIWVQFAIQRLMRAGLAMDTWTQDDRGEWGLIQECTFTGRITLTIAALTSKDRDRLADAVIAQLAFARAPDLVIYNPRKNVNQMKGLITALDNNPYVSMTLNTDVVNSGGQTVTSGVPWAQNILLYEDTYAIDCTGQFNLRFSHDGVYSLAEVRSEPHMVTSIPPEQSSDPRRFPKDPPGRI